MPRAAQIAVFVTLIMSVAAAVHFYVWVRLVADPDLPLMVRRGLSVVLVLLFASIPLTFYAGRSGDAALRRLVTFPGYVWMGIVFILFTLVLGLDVLRGIGALIQRIVAEVPPSDPARRVTIARLFAGTVALVGGGATIAALYQGRRRVAVKEVRIRLARLPKALHGTTLVQLSDVHVGPTLRRQFVETLVAQVNALSPDVIAITGDLVDGSVTSLKDQVAPIRELKSRFGTFFVTGNHEYYSGAESWCGELATLGVRVLHNERVSIGDASASFDLAGVDDYSATRFGGTSDVGKATLGRDPARALVLLAHQPRSVFEADRHDVDLQLSGHTHGGQIWPWNYLVYLQQPVVAGLARIGRTLVYVSSGTGYWGPPMRLHAPAEITRIVLESGEA